MMANRGSRVGIRVLAVLGVSTVGCFASPDLSRIACQSDEHCAPGYQCDLAKNKCRMTADAAVPGDANRDQADGGDVSFSDGSGGMDVAPARDLGAYDSIGNPGGEAGSGPTDSPADLPPDVPDAQSDSQAESGSLPTDSSTDVSPNVPDVQSDPRADASAELPDLSPPADLIGPDAEDATRDVATDPISGDDVALTPDLVPDVSADRPPVAECVVNQGRCVGNRLQRCGDAGTWTEGTTDCTATNQTCLASGGSAECAGVCAPEQVRCSADLTGIETCMADGQWGGKTGCPGQTCVDSSGTPVCAGVCPFGKTQCSGNGTQTCNANGQWGTVLSCPAVTPQCTSGVCSAPNSCSGLASICGSSQNRSCCESPVVVGGTFDRNNDPTYPATLTSFRLDTFEVTVGRFRRFVGAVVAGWRPASGAGKHSHVSEGRGLVNTGNLGNEEGWDSAWNAQLPSDLSTWNSADALACSAGYDTWVADAGNETLPINCVNWFQAYAFCIWDGGFLPSEAEWNYVAAGGSEQRPYPWGTSSPGLDSSHAAYACFYNGSGPGGCTGRKNIASVGSIPAGDGRYGHADLFGNMWEWSLDYYLDPLTTSCSNCAHLPKEASERAMRGNAYSGGFSSDNTARYRFAPGSRGNAIGIRCARIP